MYTIKCVDSFYVALLHNGKCNIKPFVAPEEAACNLINCLQGRDVMAEWQYGNKWLRSIEQCHVGVKGKTMEGEGGPKCSYTPRQG